MAVLYIFLYIPCSEPVVHRFGRQTSPHLLSATGFCQLTPDTFIVPDARSHRGYILDTSGNALNSFPLIYKYNILQSTVVDRQQRIVVPVLTRDGVNAFNTKRHVGLAYYNTTGQYLNSAFLPPGAEVKAMAVTEGNEIICTDYANSCIHVVHEKQRYLKNILVPMLVGDEAEPKPWGVAVSPRDGTIAITDPANHCIKLFNKDGHFVEHFGSFGERPGQFKHPMGIGMDKNNRIVVADPGNNRVQLFDSDLNFLRYIVRYNQDAHVYLQPTQVAFSAEDEGELVVVFLESSKHFLDLAELRVYRNTDQPHMFSC